jgi:predicted ATP-dependent endonuclease of OLD family
MFIKKLQIFNYKSYINSNLLQFTPGINIIVGRNNSGKTSLLELLTLNFENHPHKSIKTLPNKHFILKDKSKLEITLHINKEELRSFIKRLSTNIGIPKPKLNDDYVDIVLSKYHENSEEYHIEYINYLNVLVKDAFHQFKALLENSNFVELSLSLYPHRKFNDSSLIKLLNFESYEEEFNEEFYKLKYDENEELVLEEYIDVDNYFVAQEKLVKYKGKIEDSIGKNIVNIFQNRIYRFQAERLNISICKFENNSELKSDASNLAEVLCILQGKNPGIFDKFNKLVSTILPEIKWISVVSRDNSNVEIQVWTIDPNLNRDDLSLSISLCGSGVSQVLAILYIIVSSEEPRTLIIDEPQSFLHPGAAKKLIEAIKEFPQHQYFIATHSPEIITTADPSNIIKLQYEDSETIALVIDSKQIESQNAILAELGVRLSDVFGADSILWVEGQTEEKCFPLILEKVAKISLKGIKILSVNSTDALLDGKRSDLVFDVYEKITIGTSLFPPAIGFIFDRENKTSTKIQELENRGKYPVKFLRLPMYENYLLNAEAISAIINEEATWLEEPITSIQVQEYLDIVKHENSYILPSAKEESYLHKVHGAKIITGVFQTFCGNLLEFRKTKHSYKLTKWIVENQPHLLLGLAEELIRILK